MQLAFIVRKVCVLSLELHSMLISLYPGTCRMTIHFHKLNMLLNGVNNSHKVESCLVKLDRFALL